MCRELQEANGRVARAQGLLEEREQEIGSMTDQLQEANDQLQACIDSPDRIQSSATALQLHEGLSSV